jgi:uncharacterized protein involved in exopolysaccharide biosynthesis
MQEKQPENILLDLINCLRKHVVGMMVIFACIVTLVTIITLMQTPIYEVGSSVLVKYGREYIYRAVDNVQEGDVRPLYSYDGNMIINTELEIFKSNELMEKVIQSMGVAKIFPSLARGVQDKASLIPVAINRFKNQLNVSHIKGSNVIAVTFQHPYPEVAVEAVNSLTEFFKERHLQIFKNPQTSFLKEQVDLTGQQLEDAENALKIFKQENHIFSLKDQQETFMHQYANLNSLLITENGELVGLAERKAVLESQLKQIPQNVELFDEKTKGSDTETVGYKLLDLKMQENDLLNKYKDNNREIDALRQKIALAEEFIENQEVLWRNSTRKGKNPLYGKVKQELILVKASYVAQEKKNNTLRRQINEMKDQLQDMTELETDLNRLNNRLDAAEKTHSTFLGKYEESRIQDAMDSQKMVNVVVIEKPIVPTRPIKPRKKLRILIGMILGAACSLLYALSAEYMQARKP